MRAAVHETADTLPSFPQFVWLWNRVQGRGTPALHLEIACWLHARWQAGDRRLLLMVFRDAGKSTLVGLFCSWLLLRSPSSRILVLAAESGLALKMSRNVRRLLERHPLTPHLIPDRPEQWAADALTIVRDLELRDPSLLARGIGGNITGSRADLVVCDDVEVPNTTDSVGKRADLRERLRELSFVLVPDGTMLFVGTPHSYYSIYAAEARAEAGEERPFLDGYTRLVLPLFDATGKARWPERFTAAAVEERLRAAGPARFRSQMLLEPTHIHDIRLDPDRLIPYGAELVIEEGNGETRLLLEGHRLTGVACFWDPAFGRDARGDASVVAAVFTDGEGGYWLHAIRYLRTVEVAGGQDPLDQACNQVADFLTTFEIPTISVERNGIGQFVPGRLRSVLTGRGLGIRVADHASSIAKERRILEAFDPVLAAGALRVHKRVWETPFVREMREWLPGGHGHDDGLDAVAACLAAQPVRLGPRPSGLRRPGWQAGAQPHLAATRFNL